jgi:hypothetical protein
VGELQLEQSTPHTAVSPSGQVMIPWSQVSRLQFPFTPSGQNKELARQLAGLARFAHTRAVRAFVGGGIVSAGGGEEGQGERGEHAKLEANAVHGAMLGEVATPGQLAEGPAGRPSEKKHPNRDRPAAARRLLA